MPLLPGLAQVGVETPVAPYREHAAGVAAADEDRILFEHEGFEIARRAREQRQVRRPAVELAEARVETQPSGLGSRHGRCQ